jgi:hypothetical protein
VLALRFQAALGDLGTVLDARIADSMSLTVLRAVLREGITRIDAECGELAARNLIAKVRPLFAAHQAELDRAATQRRPAIARVDRG